MDGFEEKRKMVKVLLDSLKKSAGDEMARGTVVDGGRPAPMPPKGVEQTKLPQAHPTAGQESTSDMHKAEMDGNTEDMAPAEIDHPHRKESFEAGAADKMADGGMPSNSDEPERVIGEQPLSDGSNDALGLLPQAPKDEQMNEEDQQKRMNEDLEESDEDNNQSAFDAFFPRKKKK